MTNKKMVAAMAAVTEWMREEGESNRERRLPVVTSSVWSLSGRQQIMNTRSLIAARLWK